MDLGDFIAGCLIWSGRPRRWPGEVITVVQPGEGREEKPFGQRTQKAHQPGGGTADGE